jgi:hypothetical protein
MMPMAMRRKPSKLEKVENTRRYSCARKIMLVNVSGAHFAASPEPFAGSAWAPEMSWSGRIFH